MKPTTPSTLCSRKGMRFILGQSIASGGEGVVHATHHPEFVVKLYHDEKVASERRPKLERMVADGPGASYRKPGTLAWPRGLLHDESGAFRGFVMPRARGVPLSNSVLVPTVVADEWRWSRLQLTRLLRAVLAQIARLHDSGILLGDLNGNNILASRDGAISFIDCDSYQIGGFPCPVGTPAFTPPELYGADFAKAVRTPEHEAFAIAVLVFLVLFLGKQPYAQPGLASLAANARDMRFPYALSQRGTGNPPDGPWLQIWMNLPTALQEAFAGSFDRAHRRASRLPVRSWLALLDEYEQLLLAGRAAAELLPIPCSSARGSSTPPRRVRPAWLAAILPF